ncbi:argininosuccinate lyase [Roseivirga misakiensis]|uniref:Argininosuccinate lyase n=1 Tax=Roseivirga misakiensis TaxID=1563681 RepID=A0A1E5T2Y3_9BACT|nr:argininosuccinate lyase [Roseivirga misakiensis]OEK05734.1 argininosuccinate lyase [Roseivirga misakiensis]
MKLWQKETNVSEIVERYTVGRDLEFDIQLAPYDVLGSLAHTEMLASIGLLEQQEKALIHKELKSIYQDIADGDFEIQSGVEDIHSQIELLLTDRLGDVGKKIHSGRSRNDQVLVDLKLFMRQEIQEITHGVSTLFDRLLLLSDRHKETLMPGYTHMQVAMPSSFGLWFGAYAESLVDDLHVLHAAYKIVNKNPLGSGAGYGSSFPLNRRLTTDLLGFEDLNYNVVYAMMGRGKAEKSLATGMAAVAGSLSKFAMDVCLYMGQDFGFLSFPDELTTGSSIMPHKKNPDVFELMRGKCNRIQALPNDIALLTANLPVGYHREMQLIKEVLFPAIQDLKDCLFMCDFMLQKVVISTGLVDKDKYKYLFSVEETNKLVLSGVPFRDAYKQVGLAIEKGEFNPQKLVNHSHEGSIGQLNLDEIQSLKETVVEQFNFAVWNTRIKQLVSS